jgi:hypothetical protein
MKGWHRKAVINWSQMVDHFEVSELLNTVEPPSCLGTNEAIFVGKIWPRTTVFFWDV